MATTRSTSLIDNQVILTGDPNQIDTLVGLSTSSLTTRVNFINTSVFEEIIINSDLVIRCYDTGPDDQSPIKAEAEVWEFIKSLYKIAYHNKLFVLADPNCVMRNQQSGSVAGGPAGNAGGEAALEAFIRHWAFMKPMTAPISWGINLDEAAPGGDLSNFEYGAKGYKGDGIQVFVLDTYPNIVTATPGQISAQRFSDPLAITPTRVAGGRYDETECYAANAWLEKFEQQKVLQFRYPVERRPKFRFTPPPEAHVVQEHGTFVAGLVDRVAPNADIHLIEALDDKGHGDLFTLLEELNKLLQVESSIPFVVNLSLMVDLKEDFMDAIKINEALSMLAENHNDGGTLSNLLQGMIADENYIAPLRLLIQKLVEKGNVVVAAAGNGSKASATKNNLEAELPAAYSDVIAVGATDKQGNKACFTQNGDVYAPGGSTGPGCDLNDWDTVCGMGSDCREFALISVVPTSQHASGFGYWRGSSFSSGMVSGLAALVLQKHHSDYGSYPSPSKVKEFILEGASEGPQGLPIINVGKTLSQI